MSKTPFGSGGKIIKDHTDVWCMAKLMRFRGRFDMEAGMKRYDEWELAIGLKAIDFKDPKTGEMRPYIVWVRLDYHASSVQGSASSLFCTSWSWITRRGRQLWRRYSILLSGRLSLGNNKPLTRRDGAGNQQMASIYKLYSFVIDRSILYNKTLIEPNGPIGRTRFIQPINSNMRLPLALQTKLKVRSRHHGQVGVRLCQPASQEVSALKAKGLN